MCRLWLALVLVICVHPGAPSAAVTAEVGAGINGSRDSRLVMFGMTRDAGRLFGLPAFQAFNVGSWDGRYDASIVGVAQGIRFNIGQSRLQFSVGGAYVSQTSDRLSTEFEFYEQLMLRRNVAGLELALSYRHWSNAGMRQPNRGMDFVGFAVSRAW